MLRIGWHVKYPTISKKLNVDFGPSLGMTVRKAQKYNTIKYSSHKVVACDRSNINVCGHHIKSLQYVNPSISLVRQQVGHLQQPSRARHARKSIPLYSYTYIVIINYNINEEIPSLVWI